MRIFIRGNDRGNAVLMALILITILSTLFISFVPRIRTIKDFACEYKTQVLHGIEHENMEIKEHYDLN